MNNYTREDILRMVEEEDVGFIRLQFTDMYGTLKNVAKHPVTKPNIEVIRRSEENLAEKIDELMQTALDTAEIIEVK